MNTEGYKINRRALSGLTGLPPEEDEMASRKLAELRPLPPSEWPEHGAPRFGRDDPLYLALIGDSLRIILRAEEGQPPEIVDFVRRETLEYFREWAEETSAAR